MNSREFATWLKTAMSTLPGVANFFNRPEVDEQVVQRKWALLLSSVSLVDADAAIDWMLEDAERQPQTMANLPSAVRSFAGTAKRAAPSKETRVKCACPQCGSVFPAQVKCPSCGADSQYAWRCSPCEDTGIVVIWNLAAMQHMRRCITDGHAFGLDPFAGRNRSSLRCNCEEGRNKIKIIGVFNPSCMVPICPIESAITRLNEKVGAVLGRSEARMTQFDEFNNGDAA